MTARHLARLALLLALLVLAQPLAAQTPKLGKGWYTDATDIGFRVRTVKGWDFLPAGKDEPNGIGAYRPPRKSHIELGGGARLHLAVWLVKFDLRAGPAEESADQPLASIDRWMRRGIDEGRRWKRQDGYPKPLAGLDGPKAEYSIWTGETSSNPEGGDPAAIHCYTAVYTLADDLQVALVGVGPAEPRKWRGYETTFAKLARSFQVVEVERLESSPTASAREARRAELTAFVAGLPSWTMKETENYFVVTTVQDVRFLDEVCARLEALQSLYRDDYPLSPPSKGGTKAEDLADRMRCNVVRVLADVEQYHDYGGPAGTAGFWLGSTEELVIYDTKAKAGRRDAWATLNHEAFHQYFHYRYGPLPLHPWFSEGTGDFYGGYEYEKKRFTPRPLAERVPTIRKLLRDGRHAPLEKLVRYARSDYYDEPRGSNPHGLTAEECYAQGWSFIWFLRTGPKKAKGWNEAWTSILPTYLDTLITTGDRDAAVAKAFAGVDWTELERCWQNYIL